MPEASLGVSKDFRRRAHGRPWGRAVKLGEYKPSGDPAMTRQSRKPLSGAFWAEVEVGFLKVENEVKSWPTPSGDSF